MPMTELDLPVRVRPGLGRLGRFGAVGLLTAGVYALTVAAAMELGEADRQAANLLGLGLAALWSYLGHRRITFRATTRHRRSVPRFAVQLGLTTLLSAAATGGADRLGLPYGVGVAMVILGIPVLSFVILRAWVFVDGDGSDGAGQAATSPKSAKRSSQ